MTRMLFNWQEQNSGGYNLELGLSNGKPGNATKVEIATGADGTVDGWSRPEFFTNIGNSAVFYAHSSTLGDELWISNGTAAGTHILKDIIPGSGSGAGFDPVQSYPNQDPTNIKRIVGVGNTVFFTATDGSGAGKHGVELWKTNGTEAGTVMVSDIRSGTSGSNPFYLTKFNNQVFFTADDGVNGTEIWKSDGVSTTRVTNLPAFQNNGGPFGLIASGSNLYFMVYDGVNNGQQIYVTNGSFGNEHLLSPSHPTTADPRSLTDINGTLYFTMPDSHGYEMWKTDGTNAGTVMVADIFPGDQNSNAVPRSYVSLNGAVYFFANDGVHGEELWRTNGIPTGQPGASTTMVKDINTASGQGGTLFAQSLVTYNGKLYFAASDGISGGELWTSDGTELGTKLLKDIVPSASGSNPLTFKVADGFLWFVATDPNNSGQQSLFRSDGSAAGTVVVTTHIDDNGGYLFPGFLNPATVSDFDGNATSDVLWKNDNGQIVVWKMQNGGILSESSVGSVPANWSAAGVGDYNGDGTVDALWRQPNGTVVEWKMQNGGLASEIGLGIGGFDSTWKIVGKTGDYNGDGTSDILWRNTNSGAVALWKMQDSAVQAEIGVGTMNPAFVIQGTGDFNGDGTTDILMRNAAGFVAEWKMQNSALLSETGIANQDLAFSFAGTGDFNGDGTTDILWKSSANFVSIWQMKGGALFSDIGVGTLPAGYTIANTGDYNGDGTTDILLRNASGTVALWSIKNSHLLAESGVGSSLNTTWHVADDGIAGSPNSPPASPAEDDFSHQFAAQHAVSDGFFVF